MGVSEIARQLVGHSLAVLLSNRSPYRTDEISIVDYSAITVGTTPKPIFAVSAFLTTKPGLVLTPLCGYCTVVWVGGDLVRQA